MDGLNLLISPSRSFYKPNDFVVKQKYGGEKGRQRRRTWAGLPIQRPTSVHSDVFFIKFCDIYEDEVTCNRVMSHHSSGLIATNRNVVSDLELNFGDSKDVTLIDRNKTFDAVVFDVLKVSSDDIAQQLTLIDLPLFQSIGPEELTCCQWTSKRKYEFCPNVVNAIKRFNQVSYWITTEVLHSNTAKSRAERIVYFIKLAKKLQEINSLNCLKAVVSGLQSTPVYRLTKTWNMVPKRDKEKLEKLNELVSEENNREKLRLFLETAKLPCIPYLGMYLTDLTYINTIHPCTGGLDVERTNKMNEILRIIADFQQSVYEFDDIEHIQTYLSSVKYIDELQKFMEDDNYKLSLRIEPTDVFLKESNGKVKRETISESDDHYRTNTKQPATKAISLTANPSVRHACSINPKSSSLNLPPGHFRSPSPGRKDFVPGHRKVKSLGSTQSFLASISAINPSISTISTSSNNSGGSRFNLVDDSIVEDQSNSADMRSSSSCDSGLDHDEPETHPIIQSEPSLGEMLTPHMPEVKFNLQGFLKRKTCLKKGVKPKVASWQRYWVGITCSCLVYFHPKYRGFGGHERNNFRIDPSKILHLYGCTVFECSEPDCFQLTDESGGNVYRFRAGSEFNANLWIKHIKEASEGEKSVQPKNLITFDESDDEERL